MNRHSRPTRSSNSTEQHANKTRLPPRRCISRSRDERLTARTRDPSSTPSHRVPTDDELTGSRPCFHHFGATVNKDETRSQRLDRTHTLGSSFVSPASNEGSTNERSATVIHVCDRRRTIVDRRTRANPRDSVSHVAAELSLSHTHSLSLTHGGHLHRVRKLIGILSGVAWAACGRPGPDDVRPP